MIKERPLWRVTINDDEDFHVVADSVTEASYIITERWPGSIVTGVTKAVPKVYLKEDQL